MAKSVSSLDLDDIHPSARLFELNIASGCVAQNVEMDKETDPQEDQDEFRGGKQTFEPLMDRASGILLGRTGRLATTDTSAFDAESASRTPTPEGSTTPLGGSAEHHTENGVNATDHDRSVYVGPPAAVRGSSSTQDPSLMCSSNTSSPLNSAYPSSASLQSSLADGDAAKGVHSVRSDVVGDITSLNTHTSRTIYSAPQVTPLVPVATIERPTVPGLRRDGPHYPNQSFAALQSQYYPPPYQPHPLRTRSSHPSQNTSYSAVSSPRSRDRSSVLTGAKTAGNTPAQSPGLFSTATSKYKMASDDADEVQYSTPLLHPTHLQAPKETHKLMKDIDPISGRKIVNNYEFQSKLGSGAHGTVKLGRNLWTDEFVAIKIVRRFSKKVRLGKQESPEDKVKKEVAVLKKARHPHVVSLLEVIDDQEFGKVYLILEYVELGEIVWRTVADQNVAIFERSRVRRAIIGDVHEDQEVRDIAHFNECASRRRQQQQDLGVTNSHGGDKHASIGITPFWSLEYGDEPEDDHRSSINTKDFAPGALPSIDSSLSATPTTERPLASSITNAEATMMDAGRSTHSVPELDLVGTMWGPYSSALEEDSSTCLVTMDKAASKNAESAQDDEEYKYVPCLTLTQALEAFRDTVLGLEYLHYQGIIHRDIKPANLLWTKDHRVKISDFGVSYLGRPIREDDNNEEIEEADAANLDEAIELAKTVGTPAFYAPELCDPDLFDYDKNPERPQITGQIDVWALGVTLYGMIFGRLPFFDENEFAMYEKIARHEVIIPNKRLRGVETDPDVELNRFKRRPDILAYEPVDDELQDLLKRLLHKVPSKRITLKEVKHHPWMLRGIKDPKGWIDDTDPSLQSQGRKIEVSTQEVNEAVAPLTIVDRIKSGIRRLGSVVRGRDSRKRAESSVKGSDSSIGERQGRRTSLRGDEQIFSALRASRESAEHPLSQSVAASPITGDVSSYFPDTATIMESASFASRTSLTAQRPKPVERSISTAESVKTIRPTVPTTIVRQSTPPAVAEDLTPSNYPSGDSAASSSSSLSGIFGGAGRRFAKSIRSRERGQEREPSIGSRRSSSVEHMASNFEDPHASPSVAFSPATASGHVDQPLVLRDTVGDTHPGHSSTHTFRLPGESSAEEFQKAQDQNYRRWMQENEQIATENRQRSRANTTLPCPPSPDDMTQTPAVSDHVQDALIPVSSSDEQMTSGISESFSHPSIPSVVSGASSLSRTGEEQDAAVGSSAMSSGRTVTPVVRNKSAREHATSAPDDDEAGYNGDGDEEYDDSDDDGGIMFGKK